jgi:uncharacterized membrane protein
MEQAAAALPDDRVDGAAKLGWLCYAALAAGALLYVITIWVEVYIDTSRMDRVSVSAFAESHRHWRLRTTLIFLIWSILGGFTLPLGFGWLFLVPAWLWYVARVLFGMMRYARGLPVGPVLRRGENPA